MTDNKKALDEITAKIAVLSGRIIGIADGIDIEPRDIALIKKRLYEAGKELQEQLKNVSTIRQALTRPAPREVGEAIAYLKPQVEEWLSEFGDDDHPYKTEWCFQTLIQAATLPAQGTEVSKIQRFTAYRRNISQRDTHTALQKNADDEPQFEGVIWTDGTVTLRWLTACRSHSVWQNIGDCLGIHGHPEYGTVIEWHDGEPPKEWLAQLEAHHNSPPTKGE